MAKPVITCKTCDNGTMHPKKVYALGALGGILRFLFVIPGIILLAMGGCTLGVGGSTAVDLTSKNKIDMEKGIATTLQAAGFNQAVINDMTTDGRLDTVKDSDLTDEQRTAIHSAKSQYMAYNAGNAGAAIGGAMVGGMGMMGIFGGGFLCVLGLLFGLRKKKLVCNSCSVTINAS